MVPELGVEDFFSDVLGVSAGFLGVDNRSKIAFLLLLDCVEVVEPADLSDLAESVVEDRFRGLSAFEILSELLLLGVLDLGTSKGTKPGIVPAILAGRGFLGVLISRGLAGPDADEEDMWSPIVLLGRWGVAGAVGFTSTQQCRLTILQAETARRCGRTYESESESLGERRRSVL